MASRAASTTKRHQYESVSEVADDVTAGRVESETAQMVQSILKLQNSNDETHIQRTDIELNPTLEYRPRVNIEDNDKLTTVVRIENTHAGKPVPDSSDNGKIRTNAGKVQLSIDHPSGKNSVDSVVGSSNEN